MSNYHYTDAGPYSYQEHYVARGYRAEPRRRSPSTDSEASRDSRRSHSRHGSRSNALIRPRTATNSPERTGPNRLQTTRAFLAGDHHTVLRPTVSSNGKGVAHPADDDPDYSSSDEHARQKKARNKQLLYTGLAAVTTIAATNNIYQSSKAYKARKKAVREGFEDEAEAKKASRRALAMDIFSVGVAAVGINNAYNGWRKMNAMRAEEGQRREKWHGHAEERGRRGSERDDESEYEDDRGRYGREKQRGRRRSFDEYGRRDRW